MYLYGGNDIYTKLLLHGDGTDESQIIIDSSSSGKTVTCVNQAQIDTAQKEFGTGSILFDGTGDYLSLADNDDWDFGTGNFTIDFWVRFNSLASDFNFIGNGCYGSGANTDGWNLMWYTSNYLQFANWLTAGQNILCQYVWTPIINTWYHIAVVRNGTRFDIYINGISIGNTTDADSITTCARPLLIGQGWDSGLNLNGWIDELRISKGIARWTSNFIPPAHAYGLNTPRLINIS